MFSQDKIKKFKRALARRGLYVSSWLISRLSFSAMRAVTHFFVAIGYFFTVGQRRIAQESLAIAFGKEKNQSDREKIIRDCFKNLGKGMIELIYFMAHPEYINGQVTIEGREHLDKALAEGKGVIGVSAHFGNFPLMLLRFVQGKYPTSAIIRPTRDAEVEQYFLEMRTRSGLKTIYSHPRKECVDTAIRALRDNELVFIPLDQNFGSGGGVFVDFFGQKAATATGPVVFALRTKAPLLPMFIMRNPDDSHRVVIEPPLPLQIGRDDKETVFINTARITQVIERYVRQYPAEWGWMHRRWKSQPAGSAGNGESAPGATVGEEQVA